MYGNVRKEPAGAHHSVITPPQVVLICRHTYLPYIRFEKIT